MKKDLAIDISKLNKSGFTFYDARSRKKYPLPSSLDNISGMLNSPLNFLEDDRATRTIFAEFSDEIISVVKQGSIYHIFGTNSNSIFMQFEGDKSIQIFDFERSDFSFVNTDLRKFAQCTCAKISCIMAIRANILYFMEHYGSEDNNIINKLHRRKSLQLKLMIKKFDPSALTKSEYWMKIVEQIDDGFFADRPSLDYFLEKNKIKI